MRITNSMMKNNILMSLNRNKLNLSTLEQQLATGKKIQKPSEDPIVAVRALKFRTNIKEIEQYQSNMKDALSWMDVTEQSMTNIYTILDRAKELCNQGSTGTLDTDDRLKIVSELEQLKEQVLQEGSVNYAGRYVYSGFRTNQPVTFEEDTTVDYTISESFKASEIEKITNIKTGAPATILDTYRVRLAYDQLDSVALDTTGVAISLKTNADLDRFEPPVGEAFLNTDTGELIFNTTDVTTSAIPDFTIQYNKSSFVKGDLHPNHYVDYTDNTSGISYTIPTDEIKYQISYNQGIKINTLAKDVITNDMIRDLDELIQYAKGVPDDGTDYSKKLASELRNRFDKMLGKIDNHLKNTSKEIADLGSRENRVKLTQSRLEEDYINFTELMSNNEDIDITETVIKMTSSEVVYNASLMSSSKIMQPSLLDFLR